MISLGCGSWDAERGGGGFCLYPSVIFLFFLFFLSLLEKNVCYALTHESDMPFSCCIEVFPIICCFFLVLLSLFS